MLHALHGRVEQHTVRRLHHHGRAHAFAGNNTVYIAKELSLGQDKFFPKSQSYGIDAIVMHLRHLVNYR